MINLSQYFRSKAIAGVLAGAMAGPVFAAGDSLATDDGWALNLYRSMDVERGKIPCAHVEQLIAKPGYYRPAYVQGTRGVFYDYLASVFKDAGVRLDPLDPVNDALLVCVDKNMDGLTLGAYSRDRDQIVLNVGGPRDDVALALTLRHEAWHRVQSLKGIDAYDLTLNVTLNGRVFLGALIEADARLEAILLAEEKRLQGHPEYAIKMKKDEWCGVLYKAYEQALEHNSGNTQAASRAVIYAFISNSDMRSRYAANTWSTLMERGISFDQGQPEDTMLTDKTLRSLGDHGKSGNYMDADFIKILRSFDQDKKTGLEPSPL